MNITIITQYFLPEMGAPQNRLYELAMGLQKRGWSVSVVCALPNYPFGKIFNGYKRKFSTKEVMDRIPVKRFWLFPSNSPKTMPRIVSMLSFSFTVLFSFPFVRKHKPDYILVESPPLVLSFSAWILSKFSGAKMIMNVSDLWPLSAKELGAISDGRFYRAIEWIEHFLYNKAFICTGQSQEIVDYIKQRTRSAVYLFRNGVDTKRFTNAARKIDFDKCKIVYAGLLGVAQGILLICKNVDFAEIGLEFHIYGSGAEKQALEDFIEAHPNRGIRYYGVIPREKIPDVLSQYDATLVSLVKNIYGAVPSKIYESMAAGLPIFFSGEGEGAKIVGNNELGWVNKPGDWEKLKDNLKSYFNLSNLEKQKLVAHNRFVANMRFDREKQIDDLHEYLSSKLK